MSKRELKMSVDQPVRVIIVGLGRMGIRHLQCMKHSGLFEVVGLVDTDPEKRGLAGHVPYSTKAGDLADGAEAAVIATPPGTHLSVSVPLLQSGIHCLVEKPLALDVEQIAQMERAAHDGQAVLAVGHVERFNPLISQCVAHHQFGQGRIRVKRLSAELGSHAGDDVIADLLVHDLDWILLNESDRPCIVEILDCESGNGRLHFVHCLLDFGSRSYELIVGHGAVQRMRTIEVTTVTGEWERMDMLALDYVAGKDPLSLQAKAFFKACHGMGLSEIATSRDAISVSALSDQIRTRCHLSQLQVGSFQ
jgi:GFO/IDH/MocA oxidoreductase family protein